MSKKGKTIIDTVGMPAYLEQLAEECAELCQASLKLARVIRKENPTPKSYEEAVNDFNEESADVSLLINEIYQETLLINRSLVFKTMKEKQNRWLKRLKKEN